MLNVYLIMCLNSEIDTVTWGEEFILGDSSFNHPTFIHALPHVGSESCGFFC